MTTTDMVSAIFAEARELQDEALRLLKQGDLRDAAENSWLAVKRATNALILARTGQEPETTRDTTTALLWLVHADKAVEPLDESYCIYLECLHHECFDLGLCEPGSLAERYIRETAQYIDDAAALAHCRGGNSQGE